MILNRPFRRTYLLCGVLLDLLFSPSLFAQQQQPLLTDTGSFYHQSLKGLSEKNRNDLGAGSGLYTGTEYLGNGQRAKGTPFFLGDSALPGSVQYQGEFYPSVDLQYNLLSGEILVKDYARSYDIQLTREKVDGFVIAGHEFLYISPDRSTAPSMEEGYYERLNRTAPFLYARRDKKIAYPANAEEQPFYRQVDSRFLQLGDRFYRVESKGALLEILRDKKDELKKYIRDRHIDFRNKFEQALISTTEYYAQIKK